MKEAVAVSNCLEMFSQKPILNWDFLKLSHVMWKPLFCICENRCGNRLADKDLCLTINIVLSLNFLMFYGFTARLVSGVVGNSKDRFCHDAA